MAYKKKTYARSRRAYPKRNSTRAIASRALRVARSVTKKIEYNHKVYNANISPSNAGTVLALSAIAQGDGDNERVGDKITARSIMGRITCILNSTSAYTTYRFILVQDKQQVGDTTPSISDILQSVSTLSALNTTTPGRFKVLKNWFFMQDTTKGSTKTIQFYKKLNSNLRYNGTASTDIQKNGLYFVFLTDVPALASPAVSYNMKIGYADL